MGGDPEVRIELLSQAKYIFLALGMPTMLHLAPRFDRLRRDPVPGDARLVAGTNHVYRAVWGGVRVLYHYRKGRVTILDLRPV